MWARCAALSLTRPKATGAPCSLPEQPASRSAAAATIVPAPRTSNRAGAARAPPFAASLPMVAPHQLRLAPPAAAQRLEEGGGVGEAVGLRLHQADLALPIALLGGQEGRVADVAVLQLALGSSE